MTENQHRFEKGVSPTISATTARLYKYLEPITEENDHSVLSYEALAAIAMKNVRSDGPGYHNLRTAISRISRLCGKDFVTVPGVGIKLITDAQNVDVVAKKCKQHQKAANKTLRMLENCNANNLNDTEAQQHSVNFFSVQMILFSGDKAAKRKLESQLDGQKQLPDRQQILGAFVK